MNEEKDIMKLILMEFKGLANINVYCSLEFINKIKNGEWNKPYIQVTSGSETEFYRTEELIYFSVINDENFIFDELEKRMFECLQKNQSYGFSIVVDENNGW